MPKYNLFKIVIALAGIALLLVIGISIVLPQRSTASILTNPDNISITCRRAGDGSGGNGYLTVKNSEHIHIEYEIKAGSFDLAVCEKSSFLSKYPQGFGERKVNEVMSNLDTSVKTEISGKGSLDFEADAGEYAVFAIFHHTTGKAVVTSEPD
ncbi:MAG: hypothetical protein IJT94_15565 [Oscillibacter sp.]|nr:hypothetical protein [Oscillibacter sp.]